MTLEMEENGHKEPQNDTLKDVYGKEESKELVEILISEPGEAQTEEQEAQAPWKPGKLLLYVAVGIFLAVTVGDKILMDYVFNVYPTPYVFAIIFFFDACGRFLISLFLIKVKELFQKVTSKTILWVSFCRFGIQAGFLIGGISIKFIGAGTLAMMIQSQLLITGIFRYFIFKEKMSYNQTMYASAAALGAFAFKSNIFDDNKNSLGWDFGFGICLCMVSCILVSFMFALTEKLLKDILKPFAGWDKQFLFATIDIPVMIIMAYLNIIWDIYGNKIDSRSWNMFAGVNGLCIGTSINCIFFGFLLYFMFDWIDSIVVNILFVIAMALTWPLELILKFEKFYFSRLLILILTVICCIGYQMETIQRAKRKKLISSLMAKNEIKA